MRFFVRCCSLLVAVVVLAGCSSGDVAVDPSWDGTLQSQFQLDRDFVGTFRGDGYGSLQHIGSSVPAEQHVGFGTFEVTVKQGFRSDKATVAGLFCDMAARVATRNVLFLDPAECARALEGGCVQSQVLTSGVVIRDRDTLTVQLDGHTKLDGCGSAAPSVYSIVFTLQNEATTPPPSEMP